MHFPSSFNARELPGLLPCGVRTFLTAIRPARLSDAPPVLLTGRPVFQLLKSKSEGKVFANIADSESRMKRSHTRRTITVVKRSVLTVALLAALIPAASAGFELTLLSSISTAGTDFSPTVSPDGRYMVYNTRIGAHQSLVVAGRDQATGQFKPIRPLHELNSPYSDETPHFTENGRYLLFASDRDGSLEMPADSQGRVRVSYDLYWSKIENGRFSGPEKIPGDFQTAMHERSPSMSPDGKYLFYTTWPFGDIHKSKLMMAEWDGSKFTRARELPASVNTGNQEAAIVPVAGNLYVFSSRRPGGLGGWDLYLTVFSNGNWSEPKNLGPLVNSEGNDLHLSSAAGEIYMASDRPGGPGDYDIYTASAGLIDGAASSGAAEEEPEVRERIRDQGAAEDGARATVAERNIDREMFEDAKKEWESEYETYKSYFDGRSEPKTTRERAEDELRSIDDSDERSLLIAESLSKRPLQAKVTLRPYYRDESKKRPDAEQFESDRKGFLKIPEKYTSEGLEVTIHQPGYFPYNRIIDLHAVEKGKMIVYLDRLKEGSSIDVREIHFDANSYKIKKNSYPYLDSMVSFLKNNPGIRMKVVGHTDLHGTRIYNDKLSIQRANAVKDYLVSKGIDRNRLETEGAGFNRPKVAKKGKGFDEQNRRTEFIILKNQ